uniref:Uncharacterized protein n=1 Tax=Chromera velia CCMP2878 TaxID=1169474 RepID=A0A0K6S673_9ALVE|eukprot:Cvel_3195.t1-p1 / transcript=Cvel_3195.t1 / gene=Cvel_3195 / organism=Chromera_velia_CCMP2878 / gene_product=hypothetical protein / transcript_product=hypothetical protein / location=Cvel_scaffold124:104924-115652(-) / protein_length=2547 / sequence_SO=supercontig / SO=protein_coding / is_pseudo=false
MRGGTAPMSLTGGIGSPLTGLKQGPHQKSTEVIPVLPMEFEYPPNGLRAESPVAAAFHGRDTRSAAVEESAIPPGDARSFFLDNPQWSVASWTGRSLRAFRQGGQRETLDSEGPSSPSCPGTGTESPVWVSRPSSTSAVQAAQEGGGGLQGRGRGADYGSRVAARRGSPPASLQQVSSVGAHNVRPCRAGEGRARSTGTGNTPRGGSRRGGGQTAGFYSNEGQEAEMQTPESREVGGGSSRHTVFGKGPDTVLQPPPSATGSLTGGGCVFGIGVEGGLASSSQSAGLRVSSSVAGGERHTQVSMGGMFNLSLPGPRLAPAGDESRASTAGDLSAFMQRRVQVRDLDDEGTPGVIRPARAAAAAPAVSVSVSSVSSLGDSAPASKPESPRRDQGPRQHLHAAVDPSAVSSMLLEQQNTQQQKHAGAERDKERAPAHPNDGTSAGVPGGEVGSAFLINRSAGGCASAAGLPGGTRRFGAVVSDNLKVEDASRPPTAHRLLGSSRFISGRAPSGSRTRRSSGSVSHPQRERSSSSERNEKENTGAKLGWVDEKEKGKEKEKEKVQQHGKGTSSPFLSSKGGGEREGRLQGESSGVSGGAVMTPTPHSSSHPRSNASPRTSSSSSRMAKHSSASSGTQIASATSPDLSGGLGTKAKECENRGNLMAKERKEKQDSSRHSLGETERERGGRKGKMPRQQEEGKAESQSVNAVLDRGGGLLKGTTSEVAVALKLQQPGKGIGASGAVSNLTTTAMAPSDTLSSGALSSGLSASHAPSAASISSVTSCIHPPASVTQGPPTMPPSSGPSRTKLAPFLQLEECTTSQSRPQTRRAGGSDSKSGFVRRKNEAKEGGGSRGAETPRRERERDQPGAGGGGGSVPSALESAYGGGRTGGTGTGTGPNSRRQTPRRSAGHSSTSKHQENAGEEREREPGRERSREAKDKGKGLTQQQHTHSEAPPPSSSRHQTPSRSLSHHLQRDKEKEKEKERSTATVSSSSSQSLVRTEKEKDRTQIHSQQTPLTDFHSSQPPTGQPSDLSTVLHPIRTASHQRVVSSSTHSERKTAAFKEKVNEKQKEDHETDREKAKQSSSASVSSKSSSGGKTEKIFSSRQPTPAASVHPHPDPTSSSAHLSPLVPNAQSRTLPGPPSTNQPNSGPSFEEDPGMSPPFPVQVKKPTAVGGTGLKGTPRSSTLQQGETAGDREREREMDEKDKEKKREKIPPKESREDDKHKGSSGKERETERDREKERLHREKEKEGGREKLHSRESDHLREKEAQRPARDKERERDFEREREREREKERERGTNQRSVSSPTSASQTPTNNRRTPTSDAESKLMRLYGVGPPVSQGVGIPSACASRERARSRRAHSREGNGVPSAHSREGNGVPSADSREGNGVPSAHSREGNGVPSAHSREGNGVPSDQKGKEKTQQPRRSDTPVSVSRGRTATPSSSSKLGILPGYRAECLLSFSGPVRPTRAAVGGEREESKGVKGKTEQREKERTFLECSRASSSSQREREGRDAHTDHHTTTPNVLSVARQPTHSSHSHRYGESSPLSTPSQSPTGTHSVHGPHSPSMHAHHQIASSEREKQKEKGDREMPSREKASGGKSHSRSTTPAAGSASSSKTEKIKTPTEVPHATPSHSSPPSRQTSQKHRQQKQSLIDQLEELTDMSEAPTKRQESETTLKQSKEKDTHSTDTRNAPSNFNNSFPSPATHPPTSPPSNTSSIPSHPHPSSSPSELGREKERESAMKNNAGKPLTSESPHPQTPSQNPNTDSQPLGDHSSAQTPNNPSTPAAKDQQPRSEKLSSVVDRQIPFRPSSANPRAESPSSFITEGVHVEAWTARRVPPEHGDAVTAARPLTAAGARRPRTRSGVRQNGGGPSSASQHSHRGGLFDWETRAPGGEGRGGFGFHSGSGASLGSVWGVGGSGRQSRGEWTGSSVLLPHHQNGHGGRPSTKGGSRGEAVGPGAPPDCVRWLFEEGTGRRPAARKPDPTSKKMLFEVSDAGGQKRPDSFSQQAGRPRTRGEGEGREGDREREGHSESQREREKEKERDRENESAGVAGKPPISFESWSTPRPPSRHKLPPKALHLEMKPEEGRGTAEGGGRDPLGGLHSPAMMSVSCSPESPQSPSPPRGVPWEADGPPPSALPPSAVADGSGGTARSLLKSSRVRERETADREETAVRGDERGEETVGVEAEEGDEEGASAAVVEWTDPNRPDDSSPLTFCPGFMGGIDRESSPESADLSQLSPTSPTWDRAASWGLGAFGDAESRRTRSRSRSSSSRESTGSSPSRSALFSNIHQSTNEEDRVAEFCNPMMSSSGATPSASALSPSLFFKRSVGGSAAGSQRDVTSRGHAGAPPRQQHTSSSSKSSGRSKDRQPSRADGSTRKGQQTPANTSNSIGLTQAASGAPPGSASSLSPTQGAAPHHQRAQADAPLSSHRGRSSSSATSPSPTGSSSIQQIETPTSTGSGGVGVGGHPSGSRSSGSLRGQFGMAPCTHWEGVVTCEDLTSEEPGPNIIVVNSTRRKAAAKKTQFAKGVPFQTSLAPDFLSLFAS